MGVRGEAAVPADFNPYHEWLGLDPTLSSPNYFQLLGLDDSEEDAGRIVAAADRALSRVRSCRPGPRARRWTGLLDEVAAAKRCLADPAQRAAYRRQIRTPLASEIPERAAARTVPVLSELDADAPLPTFSLAAEPPIEPPFAGDPGRVQGTEPGSMSPAAEIPPAGAGIWPPGSPGATSLGGLERPSPTRRRLFSPILAGVLMGGALLATAGLFSLLERPGEDELPEAEPDLRAAVEILGNAREGETASVAEPPSAEVPPSGAAVAADPTPSRLPPQGDESRASAGEGSPQLPVGKPDGDAASEAIARHDVTAAPAAEPAVPARGPARPLPSKTATSGQVVAELGEALRAATKALRAGDERGFEQELARGEAVASLDEQKDKVARLREMAAYARQFREAAAGAVAGLRPGFEIRLGDGNIARVVEVHAERIVVRAAGTNHRYPMQKLPLGLVVALGEQALGRDDPMTWVRKAAFVYLSSQARAADMAKAASWLQEAAVQVPLATRLLGVLDDTHEPTAK